MKILYSETALRSLEEIILFLEAKWTEKQIQILRNDIVKFEKTLKDRLVVHKSSEFDFEMKVMLICKNQVKIYYKKNNDREVRVFAFWYAKGNPKTLKILLKK